MEQLAQRIVDTTTPVKEVSTPKSTIDTITPEHTEEPLETTEYIKDLWKVGEAENHFEMKSLLKEIDTLVKEEITRSKMKSDRKSYEEIIQRYEDRLKLPQNIDIYTKTEKIVELIRIDAKLWQIVKEKEDLLNGDPTKMTSSQLKKYIKEKL